jgi:CDGSH-type Zn-finger protein
LAKWGFSEILSPTTIAPEEKAMSEPEIPARHPDVRDLEPGTYYWCACGKSANQPFCDGSHAGTGFTPLAFEVKELRKAALCQCKHTGKAPFCDGTHNGL